MKRASFLSGGRIGFQIVGRQIRFGNDGRRIDGRAGDLVRAIDRFGQELQALGDDLQRSSLLFFNCPVVPLPQMPGEEHRTASSELAGSGFGLSAPDDHGHAALFPAFGRIELDLEGAERRAAPGLTEGRIAHECAEEEDSID
jgi:hypothetical protein